MTVSVDAPSWPCHVVTIASPSAVLRGSVAEFRHCGISLSRQDSGLAALREIAREPGSIVLAPADMSDIPVLDFVDLVVKLAHTPILLGLTPNFPDGLVADCLDRGVAGIVALPTTPARFAAALKPLRHSRDRSPDVELQCGRLTLSSAEHRVLVDGGEVYFAPKEFEVLKYLMRRFPRIVTIDELAREFAAGDPEHAMPVRIAVYRIRTKLARVTPEDPPLIATVRGIGYRVVG